MTRTRKIHALRVGAKLFGVLTVLIAVAALAQTKQVGQPTGRSRAVRVSANVSTPSVTGPNDPNAPLFLPAVTYDAGGCPSSLAIADVSGDVKPDVVVTNDCANSEGSVGVFLGNGDGTFKPAVTYDSGGRS